MEREISEYFLGKEKVMMVKRYRPKSMVDFETEPKLVCATDRETGDLVMVKCFHDILEANKNPEVIVNLIKTLHHVSEHHHPYILNLINLFSIGADLNMTFDFFPATLQTANIKKMKLSEDDIVHVAYKLLSALHFIHTMGLAHLAVNPASVYVDAERNVRLGRFDMAKPVEASEKMFHFEDFWETKTSSIGRAYLAPEFLLSRGEFNSKADVWSLGCVLFRLLKNKSLFKVEDTPEKQLNAIFRVVGTPDRFQLMHSDVEFKVHKGKPVGKLCSKASFEMQSLLRSMLDTNPDTRVSSAEALKNPIFDRIRDRELDQLQGKTFEHEVKKVQLTKEGHRYLKNMMQFYHYSSGIKESIA